MLRHIVPNILAPLIVQATFGFAGVILVEASLSFLGLGRLHNYTWGALLAQGTTYLWRTQHLAMAPGPRASPRSCSAATCSATACATASIPAA